MTPRYNTRVLLCLHIADHVHVQLPLVGREDRCTNTWAELQRNGERDRQVNDEGTFEIVPSTKVSELTRF